MFISIGWVMAIYMAIYASVMVSRFVVPPLDERYAYAIVEHWDRELLSVLAFISSLLLIISVANLLWELWQWFIVGRDAREP
jgi:hypothetical protein